MFYYFHSAIQLLFKHDYIHIFYLGCLFGVLNTDSVLLKICEKTLIHIVVLHLTIEQLNHFTVII